MNASRWWWVAFGLSLAAPILTFVPLFLRLAHPELTPLQQTPLQSGYSGQFSAASPGALVWSWLPHLGLLLGWAAPVVTVFAWCRSKGRPGVLLATMFALPFLVTVALSFGVLG